ncbi:MAG: YesL family protein [Clostridiales bacterium]|nr:YesL family protein [Clostridiales bacterium]
MEDFFRKITNSRFYRFGDKLGDIMALSLLWFVFSIPLITFVPSCSALYYAINRRKEKESDTPSKDFLHSFKTNLKQGSVIGLIYLIYTAIAVGNILIGRYGIGNVKLPSFYFPLSFILLLPIIFSLPFVIVCLARFENTTKKTIINGFTLSTMYMGKSLFTIIAMIVTLAIIVVFPPSILFLPALTCMLIVDSLEKAIRYTANMPKGEINGEVS